MICPECIESYDAALTMLCEMPDAKRERSSIETIANVLRVTRAALWKRRTKGPVTQEAALVLAYLARCRGWEVDGEPCPTCGNVKNTFRITR